MICLHSSRREEAQTDRYRMMLSHGDGVGFRVLLHIADTSDPAAYLAANIDAIRAQLLSEPYYDDGVSQTDNLVWHPSDAAAIRNHFVAQINAHSDTLLSLSLSAIVDAIVNSDTAKLAAIATIESARAAVEATIQASTDVSAMQSEVSRYVTGTLAQISYEYWEQSITTLAAFLDGSEPSPLATGTTPNAQTADVDTVRGKTPANFVIRWRGKIVIGRADAYTFHVTSDDGSRLYVGGQMVVDNDGLHSARTVSGGYYLEPGVHSLRVDYFAGRAPGSLTVEIESNQIKRRALLDTEMGH